MGGQWFSCLTFGPIVPNNDWWYQPFLRPRFTVATNGASAPCKRGRFGKSLDYG